MKNNILFGIAAIIIGLSVGYYFGLYLPAQDEAANQFSKKQFCQEVGGKYLAQELKDRNYSENGVSSLTGSGQYTYSKELNTCLYANNVQVVGKEVNKTEYYIIDLSTNNKLASWNKWGKGCDDCSTNPVSVETYKEYQDLYNKSFLIK